MTNSRFPLFAILLLAAAGLSKPAMAQFPAEGDSARVRMMLELHRRAETDVALRRTFITALLRAEAILPSVQYYYDARLWLTKDSADAQRRREVQRLGRVAAESRLLDDKVAAAAVRAGLLRAADSARNGAPAGAGTVEARLYATSVALWQTLPDSGVSDGVVKKRLEAVELRKQEATIRAMVAADRRAAAAQLVGQPAGYTGEKVNGVAHGHGIRINSVGDRYEGEFRKGVGNGHGVLDAANGTRFEGEFVDGVGTGTLTVDLPSGTRYVGPMKAGRREGMGSLDLPTGERYLGQFSGDLFDGGGALEYANGGRYEGEWRKGLRQGRGAEEYPDGRVLRGRFENDRFVRPEEIQQMAALPREEARVVEPEPIAAAAPEPVPSVAESPSTYESRQVSITGRVVDSASGKPLGGAAIYLARELRPENSESNGRFAVTYQAPVELIVRRPGYVPFVAIVQPDSSTLPDIRMRPVRTDSDRQVLREADLRIYPELRSFYDRRAEYRRGSFWTPDDLARAAGPVMALLRQQPSLRNICATNRKGEWDCGKSNRGPSTIMGSGRSNFEEQRECTVRVWTNDVGGRGLDEIPASEVLAMEAYPGPSDTPPGLGQSDCATVRLWMKRASQRE